MVRVIVHAGFHKTGTSSLQDFLKINRDALAPWVVSYGKADFRSAGAHARLYGERPYRWRLFRFRRSFRRFLAGLPSDTNLILTRETFSGGMPGHRRVTGRLMTGYAETAIPLARVLIREIQHRFGPDTEIAFFYTLREREDWIRSVHGHLLRSIRMTDDLDQFRARLPDLRSPADEAALIARAIAPTPVLTATLEDYAAHPAGTAAPLLDHFGVPDEIRALLRKAPRSNTGQSADQRAVFLDLNRTIRDKAVLKSRKEALLRQDRTSQ